MKVTDVRDGITKAAIQKMYNTHIMDNFKYVTLNFVKNGYKAYNIVGSQSGLKYMVIRCVCCGHNIFV